MNPHTYMQHKNRNGKILILLELLFILASVLSIILTVRGVVLSHNRSKEEQAAAMHQNSKEATIVEMSVPVLEDTSPVIQPEILELMGENADAVGLLHFEGDRTLYVCQTTDNAYYMNHRFDGSEDSAGMIYMDYRCSLLPRSDNLILYGHNMRDGSRFGTLQRFEKKEYLLQYPTFRLTDKYETIDYVPFAVFHTTVLQDDPNYYPFDRIDFLDDKDFEQYIHDVKSKSVLEIPIEVEYGDRLLTLATCHSGLERGRLVIVCREVKSSDPFITN